MIARKLKPLERDIVRDLERQLCASQIALAEAQRAQALWSLPVVREVYVPDMCDLPLGTYQQAKREGKGPPFMKIGRRTYVLVADLKTWFEQLPKLTTAAEGDDDDDNARMRPTSFASPVARD